VSRPVGCTARSMARSSARACAPNSGM
jgi:hypothetical protein